MRLRLSKMAKGPHGIALCQRQGVVIGMGGAVRHNAPHRLR
jgi:hypothetical protein